ncbi:MAG TPA: hypothetical protein VG455_10020, partial [Acidimicrobiales bacterium]|nr:hypothetical protein [Acidimicrobiales bacterium]
MAVRVRAAFLAAGRRLAVPDLPFVVRGDPVLDPAVLDPAVLDAAVLDDAVLDDAVLDEPVLDDAPLDDAVLDDPVRVPAARGVDGRRRAGAG